MLYNNVKRLTTLINSYIGRKRLYIDDEIKLDGFNTLIYPKYSYWTLCYMISQSGAKKLLAQRPLQKMLPVDEYFPIMFNEHPRCVYHTIVDNVYYDLLAKRHTFNSSHPYTAYLTLGLNVIHI